MASECRYLGSVKLFYNFILINVPSELVVSSSEIVKMQSIVAQWCRNYHKSIKIAKHSKQLEDLSNLPTANEIHRLDNSQHRKEAIKLLSSLSCDARLPSRKDYCHVRDYLLTYVIIDNGSRTGCISNMTLKEF